MLFDTHVHIDLNAEPKPQEILREMDKNGIDKIGLLAEDPMFLEKDAAALKAWNDGRLQRLFQWTKGAEGRILPVYYINPVEKDAIEQADKAVDMGVIGFKVICQTFYPGDERAMPVYAHIAEMGKSILFHSGILYDFDYTDNGNFNRPCNWECMFQIPKLKFALAHISWPWTDECIAVFGKFCAYSDSPIYKGQKMYIDMTPGTPSYYRQRAMDALASVYWDGYTDLEKRLLFGSDNFTVGFSGENIANLAVSDRNRLVKAGFTGAQADAILGENALEFWGIH